MYIYTTISTYIHCKYEIPIHKKYHRKILIPMKLHFTFQIVIFSGLKLQLSYIFKSKIEFFPIRYCLFIKN